MPYPQGVKIEWNTAKKILDAQQYVEKQPRRKALPPTPPFQYGGSIMMLVTTALNPMSSATPGKNGRGKIQKFNGTSYSDLSSTVYPIHNDTEKTVAVGAYLLVTPAYGFWHWVQVDKCSRLS